MILQQGDNLLLCSDGLWGALGNVRIAKLFADDSTPLERSLPLMAQEAAQAKHPGSDNVTAVALRWRSLAKKVPPARLRPRTR